MAVSILILPRTSYANNKAMFSRVDDWLKATALEQHATELHRKLAIAAEKGFYQAIIEASALKCSVMVLASKSDIAAKLIA